MNAAGVVYIRMEPGFVERLKFQINGIPDAPSVSYPTLEAAYGSTPEVLFGGDVRPRRIRPPKTFYIPDPPT